MIRLGVPRVETKKREAPACICSGFDGERVKSVPLTIGAGVTKSKGPVILKSVMPLRIFLIKDWFLAGSENPIQQDLRHTRLSVDIGGDVLTF
jgi:hypothetical protein